MDALPYFADASSAVRGTASCRPSSTPPRTRTIPTASGERSTFLVIVPDVIHTRVVEPIAAFTWGYRLHGG